jgi:DNA-binding transcriptional LysR family regulator
MRRLEDQIGKSLLRRTTRSLELTRDGESLMGYAREILALNRDAMRQLSKSSIEGKIRVGISEDFAHPRLFGVLQDFASCYPAVQISVRVDIPGEMIAAMSGACRCRAGKRSRCRERRDARHATGESRLPGAFCVRRCGRVRNM